MTGLYSIDLTKWDGLSPIGDVKYAPNIGDLWSNVELEEIGLFRPDPPEEVPEGMMSVGLTPSWVEGILKYVHVLVPTPPVTEVSAAQAKLALDAAGVLEDVTAVISSHPVNAVRIWFADAGRWNRWHPYVVALGIEMGYSDERIDGWFSDAAKYE